jgi:fermentation-respiration switch protein FrsA (DUF1100 family)
MKHSWYVTFEVPTDGALLRRRHPRLTKTFETEAAAKDFARTKVARRPLGAGIASSPRHDSGSITTTCGRTAGMTPANVRGKPQRRGDQEARTTRRQHGLLRIVPVSLLMLDQFRSDQRIARVMVPLLVMHGTSDPAIPIDLGERLFALAHEPKRMVRFSGGGHENLDDFGATETARQFIAGLKG